MESRPRRLRRLCRLPVAWSAWIASGVLHVAMLMVLGLLMRQLGVIDGPPLMTELVFESPDEAAPLELVTFVADGERDEGEWDDAEASPADALESLHVEAPPPEDGFAAGNLGGAAGPGQMWRNGSPATQGVGRLPPGAGAEFFGTVAYGDRFVFVLDSSTSMSYGGQNAAAGNRFQRATAELLYSIERLTPEQSFYVILFCGETRRMFDDESLSADPVHATRENKDRLRAWLAGVTLGPWTDPRDALRLGLDIRPSAVFLLSDGEFNKHESGLPTDRLEVPEVIERFNAARAPIHTVAFEDPINRETLAGLSAQTGGQTLWVPPLDANGLPVSDDELARGLGAMRPPPQRAKRPAKPLLEPRFTAHLTTGRTRAVVEYRDDGDGYWLKFPSGGQSRYSKSEIERIDPLE